MLMISSNIMFIFPINRTKYILLRDLYCTEEGLNTVFIPQNLIATIFKVQLSDTTYLRIISF